MRAVNSWWRCALNNHGYILALTLVLVMALAFMVGFLFWQGRGSQALIQSAIIDSQLKLKRVSLLNILWEKGLSEMKENNFFPDKIELEIDSSPPVKATLSVSPEDSRLNLNKAEEDELYNFFVKHDISPEDARVMVDSLLDWRDKDDFHRLNGAEKDYYLPFGYRPRNGPLKDFSEVALIKGFGPYKFWINPGIYRWVTIYTDTKDVPQAESLWKLEENKIYRLELSWEQGKKIYRYLEIFRYKRGKREKLFAFEW
ncbi:general secretion pathway protein GspK [Thermodesulfatator indicus]